MKDSGIIDTGFLVDESNYSKTMCQTSCNEHGEMIVVCSIKFKQQQPMWHTIFLGRKIKEETVDKGITVTFFCLSHGVQVVAVFLLCGFLSMVLDVTFSNLSKTHPE